MLLGTVLVVGILLVAMGADKLANPEPDAPPHPAWVWVIIAGLVAILTTAPLVMLEGA